MSCLSFPEFKAQQLNFTLICCRGTSQLKAFYYSLHSSMKTFNEKNRLWKRGCRDLLPFSHGSISEGKN